MTTSNSIFEYKNYGKINIKLANILETKGLKRYNLSKLTGIRFEVINKWCENNVERADLDVLAKLCYSLDCTIEDILEYVSE